jgi:hypothetical protein
MPQHRSNGAHSIDLGVESRSGNNGCGDRARLLIRLDYQLFELIIIGPFIGRAVAPQ